MNGPSYVVVGVLIILFVLALRKACEPYLAADAVVMVEVGTAAAKRNIRIVKNYRAVSNFI